MKIHSRSDLPKLAETPAPRMNGSPKAAAAGGEPGVRRDTPADFDTAKVEALKAAIREGRFQVNAEAVAERLLQEVREMLAGKR